MENKDKKLDRISRLQLLIDTHFDGKKDELGKFLSYKDGAFVRQMLSGSRPISEKTIDRINSIKKFQNWFSRDDLLLPIDTIGTGIAHEQASYPREIQEVIDLMMGTDGRGRQKIRIAVEDALLEYQALLRKTQLEKTPSVADIMAMKELLQSDSIFPEKEKK